MTPPPSYPRTPYLDDEPSARWLGQPLLVEEKLDGANVAVWWTPSGPQAMSRGGPDAMDRAGQLGRLRAWVVERYEAVTTTCARGSVIYGEWLWMRHRVPYDALPDLLVVLDLWHAETGFAVPSERDSRCRTVGLVTPPLVARDVVLRSVDEARGLIARSAWGPEPMEGVVLRAADGRRAKVVRPGFEQRSDEEWMGPSVHNAVRPRQHTRPPRHG